MRIGDVTRVKQSRDDEYAYPVHISSNVMNRGTRLAAPRGCTNRQSQHVHRRSWQRRILGREAKVYEGGVHGTMRGTWPIRTFTLGATAATGRRYQLSSQLGQLRFELASEEG